MFKFYYQAWLFGGRLRRGGEFFWRGNSISLKPSGSEWASKPWSLFWSFPGFVYTYHVVPEASGFAGSFRRRRTLMAEELSR